MADDDRDTSSPSIDMLPLDLDDDVLRELFDLPLWLDSLFEDGGFNPDNSSSTPPSSPKTVAVRHPKIPQNKRKADIDISVPSAKISKPTPEPQAHCSRYPPQHSNVVQIGNGSNQNQPQSFNLISETNQHIKKYNTDARTLTLQFRDINNEENLRDYLQELFDELLSYLSKGGIEPGDRVGLTILNNDRVDQRPIGISVRRWDQVSSDVIMQTIEAVLQSNEEFFINGQIQVCTNIVYYHYYYYYRFNISYE